MLEIGNTLLCIGWLFSAAAAVSAIPGLKKNALSATTPLAAWLSGLTTLCGAGALVLLIYGFLHNDFANQYIWRYSSVEMSPLYKLSAVWAGVAGGFFFFTILFSCCSLLLTVQAASFSARKRALLALLVSVANCFFFALAVFAANPFRFLQSSFVPPNGSGLNPALQSNYHLLHAPLIYLGLAALLCSWFLTAAEVIAEKPSVNAPLRLRRWISFSWLTLLLGVASGALWAQRQLEGGYLWRPDWRESVLLAALIGAVLALAASVTRPWRRLLLIILGATSCCAPFAVYLTQSAYLQHLEIFNGGALGPALSVWLLVQLGLLVYFLTRCPAVCEATQESSAARQSATPRYVTTFGLMLSICAAAYGLSHFSAEQIILARGAPRSFAAAQLISSGLEETGGPGYQSVAASVEIFSGDRRVGSLRPEIRTYLRNQETVRYIAEATNIWGTYYATLLDSTDDGSQINFQFVYNPLQLWFWIGVLIFAGGTVINYARAD